MVKLSAENFINENYCQIVQHYFCRWAYRNLDNENTNKILDILFDLNEEGKTIIVVTHDQSIIPKYTKHVHLDKQKKLVDSK